MIQSRPRCRKCTGVDLKKTYRHALTALFCLAVGASVTLIAGVVLVRASTRWVSVYFNNYTERGQSPPLWTQIEPNPGAACSTEYLVRDDGVFHRTARLLLWQTTPGMRVRRLPAPPVSDDTVLTRLFAMAYETPENFDGAVLVTRLGVFVPILSGGMILAPQDFMKSNPTPPEEIWSLVWIKVHPIGFSLAAITTGGALWSFWRVVVWSIFGVGALSRSFQTAIRRRRFNAGLCPWCAYPIVGRTVVREQGFSFKVEQSDEKTGGDKKNCPECGKSPEMIANDKKF